MKTERRKKAGEWFASATGGFAVLGLLSAVEPWLGFSLPLNWFSAATAGTLGLPGIVALLVIRVIFWNE